MSRVLFKFVLTLKVAHAVEAEDCRLALVGGGYIPRQDVIDHEVEAAVRLSTMVAILGEGLAHLSNLQGRSPWASMARRSV